MNEFHSACDHVGNVIIRDNACAHNQLTQWVFISCDAPMLTSKSRCMVKFKTHLFLLLKKRVTCSFFNNIKFFSQTNQHCACQNQGSYLG